MAFRRKGDQDSLGSDPNSSSASTSSGSEGTLPRNKCKLVSSQTRDREYSAQTTWSFGKGSVTPAMPWRHGYGSIIYWSLELAKELLTS